MHWTADYQEKDKERIVLLPHKLPTQSIEN